MNGRRSVWWGRERGPRVLLNDPRGPAAVQLKPWDFFFRPETMLLLLLLPELQLPPWGGGGGLDWTRAGVPLGRGKRTANEVMAKQKAGQNASK